jgi:hypothetical protein
MFTMETQFAVAALRFTVLMLRYSSREANRDSQVMSIEYMLMANGLHTRV